MNELTTRDVEYRHDGTRMLGYLCAPVLDEISPNLPGVLLIHDAFGISDEMVRIAEQLAELGHPVFVADMWGERRVPTTEPEIKLLIAGMVNDRDRWRGRITAARCVLAAQPEFHSGSLVLLGYSFGGSSALEYLRAGVGTIGVVGVVAISPSLDLIDPEWSSPGSAPVLICTGADDPMASAPMRAQLERWMSEAGIDWQIHLYGNTRHGFASLKAKDSPIPDVVAHNPRSAARAWEATLRFLGDVVPASTR